MNSSVGSKDKVSPKPNNYMVILEEFQDIKEDAWHSYKKQEKWGAPKHTLDRIDWEWQVHYQKQVLWRAVHDASYKG